MFGSGLQTFWSLHNHGSSSQPISCCRMFNVTPFQELRLIVPLSSKHYILCMWGLDMTSCLNIARIGRIWWRWGWVGRKSVSRDKASQVFCVSTKTWIFSHKRCLLLGASVADGCKWMQQKGHCRPGVLCLPPTNVPKDNLCFHTSKDGNLLVLT